MRKYELKIGLILTLIYLSVNLLVIDDYGLTWDYHHVFFGGLYHLRAPRTQDMVDDRLPFTNPDPRQMEKTPFGPIMTTIPVASYLAFSQNLKLLPFDNAINLPTVVIGSLGIFILFLFLRQAAGTLVAFAGLALLALYPRYVGDIHFNIKDIPMAVLYIACIWSYWRLFNWRRLKDLILASALFGIAFNIKVNAVTIPATALVWTIIVFFTKARQKLIRPIEKIGKKDIIPVALYFVVGPSIAFLIWAFFWEDPVGYLFYLFKFFTYNTRNLEVVYFGNWYSSTVNVPWHYPYGYLAIVTPLPILVFFLIGLIRQITQIWKNPFASLAILWFILPLLRYLHPAIGVIDGIRHFEEVVPALAAIAAVGVAAAWKWWSKLQIGSADLRMAVFRIGSLGITGFLIYQVIIYHPFQITYFNELAGGVKGAFGRFDLDYWGTSQKHAVRWLNANAPKDAKVYIVMSGDVSGKFLRPDLLAKLNSTWWTGADYVVMLNRQSFYYRYAMVEFLLTHKPIKTIDVLGVPLTFIYDMKQPTVPYQSPWWEGE